MGETTSSGWDPFRALESVGALLRPAAELVAGPQSGLGIVLRSLFESARDGVVGRRITVRAGGPDVTFTVEELDATLDPLALSVGQLEDVRIVARDVEWADGRLTRVSAVFRNVHLRPVPCPTLVTGPVEVQVTVAAELVAERVRDAAPGLVLDLGPGDGTGSVGRVRWRSWPALGHLEVTAQPEGGRLRLFPQALVARGFRWAGVRRVPSISVPVPTLPGGLQLTRVEPADGVIELFGEIASWRSPLPASRVQALLRDLAGSSTRFDLTQQD